MKTATTTVKTATISHKPGAKTPPSPSLRQLELFKVSLQGLLAGAKVQTINPQDGMSFQMNREAELHLLKHLVYLAWQTACFAEEMLQETDEISEFTKKL